MVEYIGVDRRFDIFDSLYSNMPKRYKKKSGKVGAGSGSRITRVARLNPFGGKLTNQPYMAAAHVTALEKLRIAFADPFDPRAVGVSAPDDWPSPGIEQRHIRARFTVSSSSSGTCSWAFMPSPTISLIGTNASSITPTLAYSSNWTSSGGAFGMMTDASLDSLFTSWRPVCGGVRIRNNLSSNNVVGQGIVTASPLCGSKAVNQTVIDTLTITATTNYALAASLMRSQFWGGDSVSDLPSAGMISNPGAISFGMDQIGQNHEVLARMLPCGSMAYKWRNNNGIAPVAFPVSTNTDYVQGEQTITQVVTVGGVTNTIQVAQESGADVQDFNGVFLYVDGLPASTASLTIDYILHFEGRAPNGAAVSAAASERKDSVSAAECSKVLKDQRAVNLATPEGTRTEGELESSKYYKKMESLGSHLYKHKVAYTRAAAGAFMGHAIGYVAGAIGDTISNRVTDYAMDAMDEVFAN